MRKSHQKRSVMGEQNQVQKIEKYNENKVVRVSQELYQLDKIRWRMSTLGYRLLFAISQSVSSIEEEILPDVGFDKQSLFKYLGLDNNNDKYNRLAETLAEVGQNMLQFATKKKNGAQVWQGYTWITAYNLAMDEKYVQICINPKVRQFLMQLNKYACIQPKYYLKLSSDYQNWFYPYFKNYVKLHQWKVSIDDLKNALELTESPTYDPKKNKNANERFLSDVIGIRINDKVKAEQRAAKAEKRAAKLIEWDYVIDKNTKKVTGTLAAISQFTDINVTACAVKTGRSYTHLVFFMSEKTMSISRSRKEQEAAKNQAESDMGKRQQTRKRSGKNQDMKAIMQDLFSSEPTAQAIPNPAYDPMPEKAPKRFNYDEEQVREMARLAKMTFQQMVEKLKLEHDENGYYKMA